MVKVKHISTENISPTVKDMANIAIANKQKFAYGIFIRIDTLDLDPF